MAFLEFSRFGILGMIPFLGTGKPKFEKKVEKPAGHLKMQEAARTNQALNSLLGYDELAKTCGTVTGDTVVVDTGEKLVQIKADKLDLDGVKRGDQVDFKLDSKLDPGEATRVKGKVVVAIDGPDPSARQVEQVEEASRKQAEEIKRPLDAEDPVGDLITRRALLFQEFKHGKLDQDSLRLTWDSLRTDALRTVVDTNSTEFEKQAALQNLLDIGAFTPAEAEDLGFMVVSNFYQIPDSYPI